MFCTVCRSTGVASKNQHIWNNNTKANQFNDWHKIEIAGCDMCCWDGWEFGEKFCHITVVRSMCFISSALSSSRIWPPVQSTVSTRNSSPSFTSPTGGISGCHLLCNGVGCSQVFFFTSTVTTGLGVLGAMWKVFLLPKILFSISSISASIHNHNPHLSSASKFKRKNSNLTKKRGYVKEGEKLPTQKSFKKAIGSFAM